MEGQGEQLKFIFSEVFSFRYTSLVRRNFLRFGKRSGGVSLSLRNDDQNEEMEENEKLNQFLNFFKHFDRVPIEEQHLVKQNPYQYWLIYNDFIRTG